MDGSIKSAQIFERLHPTSINFVKGIKRSLINKEQQKGKQEIKHKLAIQSINQLYAMKNNNDLIQLDETINNEPKFILSQEVPRIIGKEEQDFKLSMSNFFKNSDPNYQIPFVVKSNDNISMTNNNITFQNQTINNMSLIGKFHSGQQAIELVNPKFYELDNDLNKNNICLSPHQSDMSYNVNFFSSQQMLEKRENETVRKEIQVDIINNYNLQNSSQQHDITSQTILNTQSRNKFLNPELQSNDIHNEGNQRHSISNHRHHHHPSIGSHSDSVKSSLKQRNMQVSIMNQNGTGENQNKQMQNNTQEDKQITTTKGTFSLLKMTYVKQFVNKLMKRVRSIMFKKLTRSQFGIIDDFASDFDYFIYNNQLIFSEAIFYNGLTISDRRLVLQKNFFSILQNKFLHILFYYLIEQLQKVFQIKQLYLIRKDTTVACLYFFSKSIRSEIHWIAFLDYSIFLKIIDIPKKISEIEQKLQLSDTVLNWLKLLKLECLVLLIAHISGCLFIRIALSEQESGRQSWITFYHFDGNNIEEQYLISFYYMIITMTTTGYGDIAPQTLCIFILNLFFKYFSIVVSLLLNMFECNLLKQHEKAFILVMALVSQNVVGYSFTTISDIVKTQGAKKKEFKTFMREINKEMNNRNMNILLQHKVSKYLEYQYMENIRKQSYEANIVDILPTLLKEEVLLDINREMIDRIDYLSKLSSESKREIALQIKQKVIFPGEIIFKEGGYNDNLFYINQGSVVISIPIATKSEKNKNQPEMNIQTLKVKSIFIS